MPRPSRQTPRNVSVVLELLQGLADGKSVVRMAPNRRYAHKIIRQWAHANKLSTVHQAVAHALRTGQID